MAKIQVKKSVTFTEREFAKLLNKKEVSLTVNPGYYDQRDGCASSPTVTVSWTEEEDLNVVGGDYSRRD